MGALTPQGPPGWHPAPPRVVEAARAAAEWCSSMGADIADVALRFALRNETVASTLVGMRTEEEVRKNLTALAGPPDPALLAGIREILQTVQDVEWMSGLPENNPPTMASL